MMIKKMLLGIAATCVMGVAQAGTDFSFSAATDGSYHCTNYCVGFVTDDGVDTVEFANLTLVSTTSTSLLVTISVNGEYYKGITTGTGQSFTAISASGGYLTAVVNYTVRTVRGSTGRYTTYRYINSGTVSLP